MKGSKSNDKKKKFNNIDDNNSSGNGDWHGIFLENLQREMLCLYQSKFCLTFHFIISTLLLLLGLIINFFLTLFLFPSPFILIFPFTPLLCV